MRIYIYDDIRHEMQKKNQLKINVWFDDKHPFDERKWKIDNTRGRGNNIFSIIPDDELSDDALKSKCIDALDKYFLTRKKLERLLFDNKKEKEVRSVEKKSKSPKGGNRVFVVHGRNLKIRDSMFQFLRSIGVNPIEWSEAKKMTKKSTPYIGEVLDVAFLQAQAILVLFTPDDVACLKEDFRSPTDPQYEQQQSSQSRPNVFFEAGMSIGRCEDRTVLVEFGELRPFSDISGRHVIRFDGSPETRYELLEILQTAGVEIDIVGKLDWLKIGDFNIDV